MLKTQFWISGWILLILFILSIIILGLLLEQISINRKIKNYRKILSKSTSYKEQATFEEVTVLKTEMNDLLKKDSNLLSVIELEADKLSVPLYKNIPLFGMFSNLATLLGLLGTVLGMMYSISVLAKSGITNFIDLLSGIAQALSTTAIGLIVAIPAFVIQQVLLQKAEKETDKLKEILSNIIKSL